MATTNPRGTRRGGGLGLGGGAYGPGAGAGRAHRSRPANLIPGSQCCVLPRELKGRKGGARLLKEMVSENLYMPPTHARHSALIELQ